MLQLIEGFTILNGNHTTQIPLAPQRLNKDSVKTKKCCCKKKNKCAGYCIVSVQLCSVGGGGSVLHHGWVMHPVAELVLNRALRLDPHSAARLTSYTLYINGGGVGRAGGERGGRGGVF